MLLCNFLCVRLTHSSFTKFRQNTTYKKKLEGSRARKLVLFKLAKIRIYQASFLRKIDRNRLLQQHERKLKIKADMFRRRTLLNTSFKLVSQLDGYRKI